MKCNGAFLCLITVVCRHFYCSVIINVNQTVNANVVSVSLGDSEYFLMWFKKLLIISVTLYLWLLCCVSLLASFSCHHFSNKVVMFLPLFVGFVSWSVCVFVCLSAGLLKCCSYTMNLRQIFGRARA